MQIGLLKGWGGLIQALISIVLALVSIVIFVGMTTLMGLHFNLQEIYQAGFVDVLSNPSSSVLIFHWAGPLVLTGISVGIAFHVGLFNIGGQGQMAMGGVVAAIWAANIVPVNLPLLNNPWILLPSTMLVGALAGGIWGIIPGYLRARYEAHEVITTILMNIIATSIILYLIGSDDYSTFIDRTAKNANARTEVISPYARFSLINPEISNFLNWSLIVVLMVAVVFYVLVYRTSFGFKMRAVGLNKDAAEAAGIDSKKMIVTVMFLSGAVAGLAGALIVQGNTPFRYTAGLEGTRGFDGIAISLIGQNNPLFIILAAILFGFLQQSRIVITPKTGVPPEFIFAFQSFIILFAATPYISMWIMNRVRELRKKEVVEG